MQESPRSEVKKMRVPGFEPGSNGPQPFILTTRRYPHNVSKWQEEGHKVPFWTCKNIAVCVISSYEKIANLGFDPRTFRL